MESLEELLEQYDYDFPAELIANEPAEPRDAARLMVLNRENDVVKHDTFLNLAKYLPEKTLLVFNDTKVIPARLKMKKETGGLVEVLYLKSLDSKKIECLMNKKVAVGENLLLNTEKIPAGVYASGTGMTSDGDDTTILNQDYERLADFKVLEKNNGKYVLEFLGEGAALEVFLKYGEMPLPPYIKNSPLSEEEKKEKYQTVFGKNLGSVAAPTASLHFSEELLNNLKLAGVETAFVTLHVSLGTFAPLKEDHIKAGKLHGEWYEINDEVANKINNLKKEGYKIVAVGTTALRTLESATENGEIKKLSGVTDLFIREGYEFKMIDGLITNFHVPRSSLLMLVSAFYGREKILKAYEEAIKLRYKLFSFGDGMLIL